MRHAITAFWLASLSLAVATAGQANTEIYIGLNEAPVYNDLGSPPDESNNNILRAVSWTTGGENTYEPTRAGVNPSATGETTLIPITVVRNGDAKAAQLIAKAATSTLFDTVYITTFSTATGSPFKETEIKLDNVAIGSFTLSDSDSNERRFESATFAYECILFENFTPGTSGQPTGIVSFKWNRKLGKDEDCS
jgi:type VI protein secretion system component Hcp